MSIRKENLSQRRQARKAITYRVFAVFIFPWRAWRLCERNCLVSSSKQTPTQNYPKFERVMRLTLIPSLEA
ncbi:MAG: hypothetical protein KZQ88_06785, partial [Candidatus Thiodiazotropha sp. (ex Dulcina madagascariensis)]|nr:hypothetical protein [Candidatus Thiodiazotropha sp. (ex Dulcina madagascariensis)]